MDIFLVAKAQLTPDIFNNEFTPLGFSDTAETGLLVGEALLFLSNSHPVCPSVLISPALVITCVYVPIAFDFYYYFTLTDFIKKSLFGL